jgi:hypothetical protein
VADPEKLAGTTAAVLPCCGAKAAGCPGTLNGVGLACGCTDAAGCPGTLSGVAAEAEVGAACGGADAAGWPGMFSGVGAGTGTA